MLLIAKNICENLAVTAGLQLLSDPALKAANGSMGDPSSALLSGNVRGKSYKKYSWGSSLFDDRAEADFAGFPCCQLAFVSPADVCVFPGQGGAHLAVRILDRQFFSVAEFFTAIHREQDVAILAECAACLVFAVIRYRIVDDDIAGRFFDDILESGGIDHLGARNGFFNGAALEHFFAILADYFDLGLGNTRYLDGRISRLYA